MNRSIQEIPLVAQNSDAFRPPPAQKRQKQYQQTLPVAQAHYGFYESMMNNIGTCLGFFGQVPFTSCCFPNPQKQVNQGNVGLISRFGRCYRIVDPGLHAINVLTEKIVAIDIRVKVEDIPRQYVMTKDNVGLNIDSVLYWQVTDPYAVAFLIKDVRLALIERTQTTLRSVVGSRHMQECVENRDILVQEIMKIVAPTAKHFGATCVSILIKDIAFSKELEDALSSAAKQRRIGESKVISARAEVESAKLMREASDILRSPAAMQIRFLETLTTMSKEPGTKVVFMPKNGKMSDVVNTQVLKRL